MRDIQQQSSFFSFCRFKNCCFSSWNLFHRSSFRLLSRLSNHSAVLKKSSLNSSESLESSDDSEFIFRAMSYRFMDEHKGISWTSIPAPLLYPPSLPKPWPHVKPYSPPSHASPPWRFTSSIRILFASPEATWPASQYSLTNSKSIQKLPARVSHLVDLSFRPL